MSTLDKNIAIASAAALLLVFAVMWRGATVALGVASVTPADRASDISVRTHIAAQFDAALGSTGDEIAVQISPPVSGTVEVQGDTVVLQPAQPLRPSTAYTVTVGGVNGGTVRGAGNQRLREPLVWRFRTAQTQILYAALDEQNREQLFSVGISWRDSDMGANGYEVGEPQQITQAPFGVWDFAVSPDGTQIVYTELKENGTSDLWRLERNASEAGYLLACPGAACSSPAWTTDGQLLAFTRRSAETLATTGGLSPPRIWLLDPATGETAELFPDGQTLGYNPLWSASGRWLGYLSPDRNGVGIYNVEEGRRGFVPTSSGESGAWHPVEDVLLVGIMQPHDEQFRVHLHRVDPATVATGATETGDDDFVPTDATDISLRSGIPAVEDTSPAWSPDGEWVAFRRKELEGERASLGKQLWVMRADGSDARPLTVAPEFDHGQPVWSPDGRSLLYHRFPLKGPDITLSVWVMDVESGEAVELVSPGQRPLWLP